MLWDSNITDILPKLEGKYEIFPLEEEFHGNHNLEWTSRGLGYFILIGLGVEFATSM